jgi:parallel beta-helix repeat protein
MCWDSSWGDLEFPKMMVRGVVSGLAIGIAPAALGIAAGSRVQGGAVQKPPGGVHLGLETTAAHRSTAMQALTNPRLPVRAKEERTMSRLRSFRTLIGIVACLLAATATASAQSTWYVDDDAPPGGDGLTWSTAYDDLQDALWAAGPGDEVWVAQGTYRPDEDDANPSGTGDRTASFQMITGVSVYGGFDGTESLLEERAGLFDQTILTGDLLGDDGPDFANNAENSYHVVTGSGTDASALLDGFTVTAGNADGASPHNLGGGMFSSNGSPTVNNCTFTGNTAFQGGGMNNYDHCSPTVTACTFTGNAAVAGGGMNNYDQCSPTVTACTFTDNTATNVGGGIRNYGNSNPTVTDCTFTGNRATTSYGGGAILCSASDGIVMIRNCIFRSNAATESSGWTGWGGALLLRNSSRATVESCTFVGNSAEQGGGAVSNTQNSSLTLLDCCFVNNVAHWAGALWLGHSPGEVTNCTFVGNDAALMSSLIPLPGYGGAILSDWSESVVNMTNCLLVGNTALYAAGVELDDGSSMTLINCTIAHNKAEFEGGGVFNGIYGGQCGVKNSILWGNAPDQISTRPGGVTTVEYSCIQGGYVGAGNIQTDPNFVGGPSGSWTANAVYDAATGQTIFTHTTAGWVEGELIGKTLNPDLAQYRQSLIVGNTASTLTVWGNFATLGTNGTSYQVHDYDLLPGTPCIDGGSNGFLPPDTHDLNTNGDTAEPIPFDLDGNPRIAWCDVDMGAYEYQGPFGDHDDNCIVDLDDFAVFEGCLSGPGVEPAVQECLDWFDYYTDADVDLRDFAVLQLVLSH